MLRPFLHRSLPLLSRLRPCTRSHGLARGAFPAGAGTDRILSRTFYSDYTDDEFPDEAPDPVPVAPGVAVQNGDQSLHHGGWCSHPNLPLPLPPPPQRRHLYVVVDDWKRGFSVHKLDLDVDGDGSQGREAVVTVTGKHSPPRTYQRLPPPAVRFEHPVDNGIVSAQFAALGSNIIAKGFMETGKNIGLSIVYDTKTAGQAIVHRLPLFWWYQAVAAGGKLYALTTTKMTLGSDHAKRWTGVMHHLAENPAAHDGEERWSWSTAPSLPPFHPDGKNEITSYAVHPGERTIFVSVKGDDGSAPETTGTFSYDTERGEWARHGDWMLPFTGEGHYDGELGAWVGIYGPTRHSYDRYLCSCDVPSVDGGSISAEMPSWKVCEEKLTSCEQLMFPVAGDMDATLVSLGGSGRFCLVQGTPREGSWYWHCLGDGDKCVLSLTTFRARYGKNGELTTTAHRLARSYILSRYVRNFHVQAFWI